MQLVLWIHDIFGLGRIQIVIEIRIQDGYGAKNW